MRHIQIHRRKPARSSEYQNLRHVVPSLRRQRDVDKLEVVTEAARYIDQLHKTLIERFVLCGIPDSLKVILGTDNANELGSQHIMNLVANMVTTQRQQIEVQQQQQQRHNSQPAMIVPARARSKFRSALCRRSNLGKLLQPTNRRQRHLSNWSTGLASVTSPRTTTMPINARGTKHLLTNRQPTSTKTTPKRNQAFK